MNDDSMTMLAEVSPAETRVALVDGKGRLVELWIERIGRLSLVDGIYRGRVRRVESSLGGAFVDFGAGTDGFLRKPKGLHEGQTLMVQVNRDSGGGKGPSLTDRIALQGRYLHWTPSRHGVSFSSRLGSGRRRAQLESLVPGLLGEGEGIMVRTAAGDADDSAITGEVARLRQNWERIQQELSDSRAPGVLVPPPALLNRLLLNAPTGEVIIDDRSVLRDASALVEESVPDRQGRMRFHAGRESLFEAHGIADDVDGVCDRVLSLRGGARLTFDYAEALTAIDVDSGAGGKLPSDKAALKTNLAVLPEVVRQIRLRNISGLVLVDFISLKGRVAKAQFLQAARQAFRRDPQQVDILDLTVAGLLEITRRRSVPPLHEQVLATTKANLAAETIACAVLRAAVKLQGPGKPVATVPSVVNALLARASYADALETVQRRLGQPLGFQVSDDADNWVVEMQSGKERS